MFFSILKNCLYLAWLLYFLWLITWGQDELLRLLHPRLWWVVGTASLIILVFLVNSIIFDNGFPGEKSLSTFFSMIILLLPIAFYFIAKNAEFDTSSLEKRGVQGEEGFYQGSMPRSLGTPGFGSSSATFSKLLRTPEDYAEDDVEIVCRSFVDEKLPENVAMCYRYLMTCCAADATPLFVFLMHPENLTMENDRWIKTTGRVGIIEKNGIQAVKLDITAFEYTEEPAVPWVF